MKWMQAALVAGSLVLSGAGAHAGHVEYDWVWTGGMSDPWLSNLNGRLVVDEQLSAGGRFTIQGSQCPTPSADTGLVSLRMAYAEYTFSAQPLDVLSLTGGEALCLSEYPQLANGTYVARVHDTFWAYEGWRLDVAFADHAVTHFQFQITDGYETLVVDEATVTRYRDTGDYGPHVSCLVTMNLCQAEGFWQVNAATLPVPEPQGLAWLGLAAALGWSRRFTRGHAAAA